MKYHSCIILWYCTVLLFPNVNLPVLTLLVVFLVFLVLVGVLLSVVVGVVVMGCRETKRGIRGCTSAVR